VQIAKWCLFQCWWKPGHGGLESEITLGQTHWTGSDLKSRHSFLSEGKYTYDTTMCFVLRTCSSSFPAFAGCWMVTKPAHFHLSCPDGSKPYTLRKNLCSGSPSPGLDLQLCHLQSVWTWFTGWTPPRFRLHWIAMSILVAKNPFQFPAVGSVSLDSPTY
jgi:hypothetical protein